MAFLIHKMDHFLTPKIREMGFAKDKLIQFHRTSARRARVLGTVSTSPWQNHFSNFGCQEKAFSDITVLNSNI